MMVLIKCAHLHSIRYLLFIYHEKISQMSVTANDYRGLAPVLMQMGSLFGLEMLLGDLDLLLQEEYFDTKLAILLKEAHLQLCLMIKRHAIPLTDGLMFPDFILKAPIGSYDGNIYESKELFFPLFLFISLFSSFSFSFL